MNSTTSFILFATDFSPRSNAAASIAAKFARRTAARLRLVHVAHATAPNAIATAEKRLDTETQRLRESGTQVEALLLKSTRPSEALIAYIRTQMPSLVVVASGAKGLLDRWASGSFSEQIAESSPVPTLVAGNPRAFDRWDEAQDKLNVLLALDLAPSSDVVLRWAKAFGKTAPSELTFCHVNYRVPTMEDAAVAPGRPVNPPTLQSRLQRDLQKKVRDQLGAQVGPVIVRPFFGDPGPCIVEIADETKAQLIIVGAHQRHGLSRLARFSVSREILHHDGRNLLCIPVTARFDARAAHIPDYRRVLVATDFSELGNAAVPFACAACAIGGLVRIVHVARSEPTANLRTQLRALIPDEMGARGQPPEVGVVENRNVAEAICAEADRFGADLVCLSSHGLGASRALHGSVTKAVLKDIRRPLLVIRRPEESTQ